MLDPCYDRGAPTIVFCAKVPQFGSLRPLLKTDLEKNIPDVNIPWPRYTTKRNDLFQTILGQGALSLRNRFRPKSDTSVVARVALPY